ncbi:FUSC family protein [Kushneria phyllosphaerae]|uniref:p-hydroxybenzoic acid efflux pump subunit AaeB n=1 Tax=Kushneria phyllosphaerae TaxID=2100822 RepID=A0A2R8CNH1_9GAMM|nr:FUSC family protein [Kushneria phyllosphaerae]SPJ34447.1 p-hydroxybenzoic acid efflux pump subunit AaeB [Kushneria phyllosphaerae]
MALGPWARVYLTPDINTLKFATKGLVAMTLSLYLAMEMQLDRPYWALISAVFLQIRPQSGLVIEKGFCQIGGTVIGGGIGILIMALSMQMPAMALMLLMIWIFICATSSALTRNFNLTYGFAMGAATAILVVVLTIVNNNSSQGVFDIAVARVSEIVLGATCATLVSMLLWPNRVRNIIYSHANTVIDQTFKALVMHLDASVSMGDARAQIMSALEQALTLNNDSSAVVYEGPHGPGRARAAYLLSQRALSMMAEMQTYARLVREHPTLSSEAFEEALKDIRDTMERVRSRQTYSERKREINGLRQRIQKAELHRHGTPLARRMAQGLMMLLGYASVMVEAHHAINDAENTRLKAPRLSRHRDYMPALTIGIRSSLLFAIGSIIYVATQWGSGVLMMVMPVIFGTMFASFPSPTVMLGKVMKGGAVGAVAALVFGNVLLAQAPHEYLMLIMVFGAPLFLGLMALNNRAVLANGLGFCIIYTILTMPSNNMTFNISSFMDRTLAIALGLTILYTVFRVIPSPNALVLRRRVIRAITDDMNQLWARSCRHSRERAADWFNGRMVERVQRLANFDSQLPEDQRYLLDLGMTGLNLGHLILANYRRVVSLDDTSSTREALKQWQMALAHAYQACAWGDFDERFTDASQALLSQLRASGEMEEEQIELVEGMIKRLDITLHRFAKMSSSRDQRDIDNVLQQPA